MTFQITKTQHGRTVILKDGITCKPRSFETREHAQAFANSCFANDRCDWKNQGRKLPKYEVREAK